MTLWREPWHDVTLVWWHVTSPVSPGPGLGVSCIFLWRRETLCLLGSLDEMEGAADSRGRQAVVWSGSRLSWAAHRRSDSWLLLPWRDADAGKSEVIIQLSDLSPTSCLRIPAHFSHSHGWSVILPVVKVNMFVNHRYWCICSGFPDLSHSLW